MTPILVHKRRPLPEGYLVETEEIKSRKQKYGDKVHKFQAAQWTHPNGHPRCKLCGQEQSISPECNREPTQQEHDAFSAKLAEEFGTVAKARRRTKLPKLKRRVGSGRGGGNPLWDGDGVQGVGQPRNTHGEWTTTGAMARRAVQRAGLQIPKSVKMRSGGKETFGVTAGGDVAIERWKGRALPGKATRVQHDANVKWARENLPNGYDSWAEQVSRVAMRYGNPMSVDARNKHAGRILNAQGIDPAKSEDKFREVVGKLQKVEAQVYDRIWPPKGPSKDEKKLVAGPTRYVTAAQRRAMIDMNIRSHVRANPKTDREYTRPDLLGKVGAGPLRGKTVRIHPNGGHTVVRAQSVEKEKRDAQKFWQKTDAVRAGHAQSARNRRKMEMSQPDEKANLIRATRDAERARAKTLLKEMGLDPEDSHLQALVTGNKTLLRSQSDAPNAQDAATLYVMKMLRQQIAEERAKLKEERANLKANPKDALIINGLIDNHKEAIKNATAQLDAVKQSNPHLVRSITRRKKAKESALTPAAQQALDRAASSEQSAKPLTARERRQQAAAQKITAATGGSVNVARGTREKVGTIAADNETTTRTRRTRAAGTTPRTPRVKAPKREPKTFDMQTGLALDTSHKPKQKYTPIKFPPVIRPRVRKATQAELEAMFPATKTRAAGTPPMGHENIRVPVKAMKSGFGEFVYMFDHHERKNKGKVTADRKRYSQAHDVEGQMRKFDRVARMSEHMSELDARIKKEADTNDTAGAVAMMRILAMRPSSDKGETRLPKRDANGEIVRDANGDIVYGDPIQTFGATTLERRHITFDGRVVVISLTGKAAHEINIKTDDPTIYSMLKKRMAKKGKPEDKVFKTTAAATLAWIKETMPDAQNKDLRTYVATTIAKQMIEQMPVPQTVAEFKNAILDVSETTANQLQHGASMSRASYIDPRVFEEWANAAGVDFELYMHPRTGRSRVIKPIGWEKK